jgi:ribosomal protein RSM22 (predicted rRNA methylase)
MQLPDNLREAIENLAYSYHRVKGARRPYLPGEKSQFNQPDQLLSYLITRMPATFGACCAVFQEIRARLPDFHPKTTLDLGAGPGTATWAVRQVFSEITTSHLIEQESKAIEMGKTLAPNEPWQWHCSTLAKASIPSVDMAILSYVLAETFDLSIIDRLWHVPLVAIIEPGTPKGFERILSVRKHILQKGANLIAPCPHSHNCPMTGGDWCHFPARIERTRLHRLLKEGTLGYEDEKYSYLVYSPTLSIAPIHGRVVRQPQKGSGHVRLTLCASDGHLKPEVITKKGSYRAARDAEWGSAWM